MSLNSPSYSMYSNHHAMEEDGFGKSWLGLGIGGGSCDLKRRPPVQLDLLFQQSVKEEAFVGKKAEKGARKRVKTADDDGQQSSHGGPSPSDGGDDGGDGGAAGARKKLRLTKEQSTLLEETFRAHNILSHAQKQELARQVNLSARQVEVWFQNRRARTKLKQTEVDCEILKRCCDSLTGENQRLRLELAQLQRSAAAGLCVRATASVCPSCDKVTTVMSGGETSGKSSSSGGARNLRLGMPNADSAAVDVLQRERLPFSGRHWCCCAKEGAPSMAAAPTGGWLLRMGRAAGGKLPTPI